MEMATDRKVMIVGGGIGGLSAANALHRAGIDVAVFERMESLGEVGAGLVLWTNGMRCLERIGVADRVRAQGIPVDHVENRTWRGKLMNSVSVSDIDRKLGGESIAIHRGQLLRILANELGDTGVRLGSPCLGWTEEGGSVTVQIAGGHTEPGNVIIGADGLRSTVRTQHFGEIEPRYAGFTIWRGTAQYEHEDFPPGAILQVRGPGAVFGITALAGGCAYWFGSSICPEGGQERPGERKIGVQSRFAGWYKPVTDVLEATEDSDILRTDIFDRNPVKAWGTGRMTLLGDAAHPTVPSLGQGACMAIEDAVVLAQCLAAGDDVISGLRQYEAQRIPRTAHLVRMARQLAWLDHWANPVACAVRDRAMLLLPNSLLIKRMETVVDFGR